MKRISHINTTAWFDYIYLSACFAFNMHTLTVVGSISDNTQTFSTHSMSHFIDLAFFEEHDQALHFFSIVHLSIPLPKLGWSHIGGTYTRYVTIYNTWFDSHIYFNLKNMDLSHIFMKFQVDLKREFIIWKAYLYSRGVKQNSVFS